MTPTLLTHKSTAYGSKFIAKFKFKNGHEVSLYEVEKMAAFNQLIGHAKFMNAQYGNVYYRGVNGLFDNVLPSIMRGRTYGQAAALNKLLTEICDNDYFHDSLKLRAVPNGNNENYYLANEIRRKNRYCVEGLLQHYAGYTRFVDVVDNHWVALWMGLHNFKMRGKGARYCMCEKREFSLGDLYKATPLNGCPITTSRTSNDGIYEYLLLIAMPYAEKNPECGIIETTDFVEVDLRKTLPSFYLRPHAQHALVVRRRDSKNFNSMPTAAFYDMASQVIGILRVRIDYASQWLGNGNLLTSSNLFPSPSLDQGYNNLLMHSDLFTNPFEIVKYY